MIVPPLRFYNVVYSVDATVSRDDGTNLAIVGEVADRIDQAVGYTTNDDDPATTASPMRATFTDSRPSCRDAIRDAIARLRARTGATEFTRRDTVAEVRTAGVSFERQTIYRCHRRMSGQQPGSAHRDLEDVGSGRSRPAADGSGSCRLADPVPGCTRRQVGPPSSSNSDPLDAALSAL
jgi:hypothetical protein